MPKPITVEEITKNGVNSDWASNFVKCYEELRHSVSPMECWNIISKKFLSPEIPFNFHKCLYEAIYDGWNFAKDPAPQAPYQWRRGSPQGLITAGA